MDGLSQAGRFRISRFWESVAVAVLLTAVLVVLVTVNGCAIVPPRRGRAVVVAKPAPSATVEVVYVKKAPPKPKVEIRPKRPSKNAVWIPGHWRWNGSRYVWVSGHWEINPRGKTWIPGHWERRPRGWVWIPGHWG